MQHRALASRLRIGIVGTGLPPRAVVNSGGGLGVDPARRGMMLFENDWERLVQLTASEALELLHFLREKETVLVRMAREDAEAVVDAGRDLAERCWQASAQ